MSSYYQPVIIERHKLGVVEHPGLKVLEADGFKVIHNSFKEGRVVVSTYDDYAEGCRVSEITRYEPSISGLEMEMNARKLLGTPWRPWYNCQHFITEMAGLQSHSPQLKELFTSFIVIGFVALATRA